MPNSGLEVEAVARRIRMQLALHTLPLATLPAAGNLTDWLREQPMPLDGDDGGDQMIVSTSSDVRRISWWAAGPTQRFIPVVVDFMKRMGANRVQAETIAAAGAHMEPDSCGSWIEVSAAGLDGGWYFPSILSLAAARTYAAATVANQRLGRWATEVGADRCVQLRRSLAAPQPITEWLIPLPAVNTKTQLDQAQRAFERLQVPWIGPHLAEVVAGLESMALRIALTDAGVSRIGLEIPGLDATMATALADISPLHSDAQLALFMGTLGIDTPASLGVFRVTNGLEVELSFAP
jgi:hypothetical protein